MLIEIITKMDEEKVKNIVGFNYNIIKLIKDSETLNIFNHDSIPVDSKSLEIARNYITDSALRSLVNEKYMNDVSNNANISILIKKEMNRIFEKHYLSTFRINELSEKFDNFKKQPVHIPTIKVDGVKIDNIINKAKQNPGAFGTVFNQRVANFKNKEEIKYSDVLLKNTVRKMNEVYKLVNEAILKFSNVKLGNRYSPIYLLEDIDELAQKIRDIRESKESSLYFEGRAIEEETKIKVNSFIKNNDLREVCEAAPMFAISIEQLKLISNSFSASKDIKDIFIAEVEKFLDLQKFFDSVTLSTIMDKNSPGDFFSQITLYILKVMSEGMKTYIKGFEIIRTYFEEDVAMLNTQASDIAEAINELNALAQQ